MLLRRSLVRGAVLSSAFASAVASAQPTPLPEPRPDATTEDAAPGTQPPAEPAPPPSEPPPADTEPRPPEPPSSRALNEPAPPAPRAEGVPAPHPPPRAYLDYSDGTFFLRSFEDNLVLVTGGRVHVDTYALRGPGVGRFRRGDGSGLSTRMFFRRFVIELGGLVRRHWFFWVGGNFAPTELSVDQETKSTAAVYDGFIGYQADPNHQIYVGQYNAPFTMENVTSSRWLDLMERALVIRTVATPYNKDFGVTYWGATKDSAAPLEYQIGVFGGDGMNRPSPDDRIDAMGRIVVRPASSVSGPLHRLHIGISGRAGSRDDDYVSYDAPALSTPGGYRFWSPTYTAADGASVHVVPAGNQLAAGAELYVPFERFDLKSELVYVHEGRREVPSTDRRATLRRGVFEGLGGYVQLSYWPIGTPRVNGHPAGRYFGVRLPNDRGKEAPYGLQLVARAEMMRLSYDGNGRTTQVPDGEISASTTNIDVNALQAGATYWATKHIRLTAEYSLYTFPGTPPSAASGASNQAAAPGAKGTPAQPSADHLHELSFRVGLAL
mgnify:CR=1 FL=1